MVMHLSVQKPKFKKFKSPKFGCFLALEKWSDLRFRLWEYRCNLWGNEKNMRGGGNGLKSFQLFFLIRGG